MDFTKSSVHALEGKGHAPTPSRQPSPRGREAMPGPALAWRPVWTASWALLLLLAVSCIAGESLPPADEAAIGAAMEEYLPRLATAYATGDLEVLRGVAAEKEIAGLEKRIRDLLAEGRIVEPTFKSVQVEQIDIWSHSNAFVTTLEVWDLAVYASGSHRLLSQELGQRNRVKYQLKRQDDGWRVLYREIETTFD